MDRPIGEPSTGYDPDTYLNVLDKFFSALPPEARTKINKFIDGHDPPLDARGRSRVLHEQTLSAARQYNIDPYAANRRKP